jgi:hypothetical protein
MVFTVINFPLLNLINVFNTIFFALIERVVGF